MRRRLNPRPHRATLCKPQASHAGGLPIPSLQLDAEMLFDRFFNRPSAAETGFHGKGIAGPQGNRRAAIWRDGDLAINQMHEFVKLVDRVPGAQRGFPSAADHAAVDRGVLHPGFHRRVAVDLGPALKVGQHRLGPRRGKAENHIAHVSPFKISLW